MTLYCNQFTSERGRDHTNEVRNYTIALVSFFINREKFGLPDNHADTCVTVYVREFVRVKCQFQLFNQITDF